MQAKQTRSDILYMTTLDTGRCSHKYCYGVTATLMAIITLNAIEIMTLIRTVIVVVVVVAALLTVIVKVIVIIIIVIAIKVIASRPSCRPGFPDWTKALTSSSPQAGEPAIPLARSPSSSASTRRSSTVIICRSSMPMLENVALTLSREAGLTPYDHADGSENGSAISIKQCQACCRQFSGNSRMSLTPPRPGPVLHGFGVRAQLKSRVQLELFDISGRSRPTEPGP